MLYIYASIIEVICSSKSPLSLKYLRSWPFPQATGRVDFLLFELDEALSPTSLERKAGSRTQQEPFPRGKDVRVATQGLQQAPWGIGGRPFDTWVARSTLSESGGH